MRETMKKISDVCKLIFGYGIMIVLFAGGLTFFAYLFALIVGGELAVTVCALVYKRFIPVIIYASTILVLFGLLTMYMAGEKALTADKSSAQDEGEK